MMMTVSDHQLTSLPKLARDAIVASLEGEPLPENEISLDEPAAVFVTLTKQGALRGCIGSLQAHRSLFNDVVHNAQAAAFHDPRFPAVTPGELPDIHIEVSVLTEAEPILFDSDADLFAKVTPNVDGIVIESGVHRATFLPQVWAQLPSHREFFNHLLMKAGLPVDTPLASVRVSHYQVIKIEE